MGIVNVTPDSFSDGGKHASPTAALAHCEKLLNEGADILDIGAESSRPGAQPLSLQDELTRLRPVIKEAVRLGVPVSVDTYKPAVMQSVLDWGADIINDIWALRWQEPGTPQAVSGLDTMAGHPACGVCLMHMHREPQTMQLHPMEGDCVDVVCAFLHQMAQRLQNRGVAAARIAVDPGIGFGKTAAQNFSLLTRQHELSALGYPVLAGWSRKSSLAALVGLSLSGVAESDNVERMTPSITAAVLAVERGARLVRVHDVRQTSQALKVLRAVTDPAKLGIAIRD